MADKYIKKGSLSVSTDLEAFLKSEVLLGLDLSEDHFWASLEKIINEFSPRNKELLEIRESMQEQIDAWHLANPGQEKNLDVYKGGFVRFGKVNKKKIQGYIEFDEAQSMDLTDCNFTKD